MFICWNNLYCQNDVASCQVQKYTACLPIFIRECAWWQSSQLFGWECICVCVCALKLSGDSAWGQQEEGVNTRPDTCFFFLQNELWNEAKLMLFSPQLTIEDQRRNRTMLALQRALNNEISWVRKHEGYESLLTLIDSLVMGNGILIGFRIACFTLWLMQLN